MENRINFIDQGTYGCVYRSEIACANKEGASILMGQYAPTFVSKVTRSIDVNDTGTQSEIQIGSIIREIPFYKQYFAPVESSCPIRISQIERSESEKCDLFQRAYANDDDFVSHKIRYVGTMSMDKYLMTKADEPGILQKRLLECHIHLQKAIIILSDANIIHYDLKSNNIIYDDIYGQPIIIDFGLSFDKTKIVAPYRNEFYAFYEKYAPWCIEIVWISFLASSNGGGLNQKIPANQLKENVDIFVYDNPIFVNVSESIVEEYRKSLHHYIDVHNEQLSKEFIEQLILDNSSSWDNYSIAAVIHGFIKNKKNLMEPLFFERYEAILNNVLFTFPHRQTAKESMESLYVIANTSSSKFVTPVPESANWI